MTFLRPGAEVVDARPNRHVEAKTAARPNYLPAFIRLNFTLLPSAALAAL